MRRYLTIGGLFIILVFICGIYGICSYFYADIKEYFINKKLQTYETSNCKVQLIDGQLAFIATGEGFYDIQQKNEDLKLIQQQTASIFAYNQAVENLAKVLENFDFGNIDESILKSSKISSDTESLANNIENNQDITIKDRFLRGFDLYEKSESDPELESNGKVKISIISTPDTVNNSSFRYSSSKIGVANIKQGIDYVKNEIMKHRMPFIGSRQIYCPLTKEIAFVGCGASLILASQNEKVHKTNEEIAIKKSSMRAESALCSLINGKMIKKESLPNALSNIKEIDNEFIRQIDNEEKNNPLNDTSKSNVSQLFQEATDKITPKFIIINASQGVLPPGVTEETYYSQDGKWLYTLAIYTPSAEKMAKKMYQEIQESAANTEPRSSKIAQNLSDNQRFNKIPQTINNYSNQNVSNQSPINQIPQLTNNYNNQDIGKQSSISQTPQTTNNNDYQSVVNQQLINQVAQNTNNNYSQNIDSQQPVNQVSQPIQQNNSYGSLATNSINVEELLNPTEVESDIEPEVVEEEIDYEMLEKQSAQLPSIQVTDLIELEDNSSYIKPVKKIQKPKEEKVVPEVKIPTATFVDLNDL